MKWTQFSGSFSFLRHWVLFRTGSYSGFPVETLTFLCSIPIFSFYVEIPTKFNNFSSIDILYENVFQNESNKKQFDKLNYVIESGFTYHHYHLSFSDFAMAKGEF